MAFSPHLLDQDGDLHFPTATDIENVWSIRLRNAQGNVRADLFHQPLPDMASGDEFAIRACQRPVVHGKLHLNRWRIDRDEWQRLAIHTVGDRLADEYFLKTCNTD